MIWHLLVAITLLFSAARSLPTPACEVLTHDAASQINWSVLPTKDTSSFSLKISIPNEYQYEEDQNNYILDLKLSFASSCAFGLNFEAVTDPVTSWKIRNDNGAWKMRYRDPNLSSPDPRCGRFEFERSVSRLEASKLVNCLSEELLSNSPQVVASLRRQYVTRTRTLGVSRSVENVVAFDLSTALESAQVLAFGSTLEGSTLSNGNISRVTILQSDSNSVNLQFSIDTFFPERIQLASSTQTSPNWRDITLISSNCTGNDVCEHIVKATLIRKNPCFLPEDKFVLPLLAIVTSATSASEPNPAARPISAVIVPETFGCIISPVSVRKLSSWMRPVQGPGLTDPLAAWSTVTRPTIPSVLPTYFMLQIDAYGWPNAPSNAKLVDMSITSGSTTPEISSKQLISALGCNGPAAICIIVAPIELTSSASSNSYASLVLSARVNITFNAVPTSIILNSWGLIDVLSSDVATGYDGFGNYDLAPSKPNFTGDTIGFSIAIGAGIAVLLAAMVGFAVSFHTADPMDDDETGPAAAGAGV